MYKYKNYVKDVSEVINSIDDDSFYRVEKTFDRESNKSMLSINDSMILSMRFTRGSLIQLQKKVQKNY